MCHSIDLEWHFIFPVNIIGVVFVIKTDEIFTIIKS